MSRRIRAGAVLVALAMGAVAGAGCSSDEDTADGPGPSIDEMARSSAGRGGVLRMGLVGPDAIDPAQVVPTDPNQVVPVDLLFDRLTTIDPATNTAVPALAEEWSTSEDGRVWTFVLRGGATFSNGEPVRGDDVKYTFERVARRAASSFAAARLGEIEGVDEVAAAQRFDVPGVVVIDDRTVQITTTDPFPQLAELVAAPSYGIVSRQAFENPDFTQGIVTSGPFVLTERSEDGTELRFEARPEAAVKLDAVEATRYPSVSEALLAFERGEIDWVLAPNEQAGRRYAGSRGEAFVEPLAATMFVGMNLGHPNLADARLREAIVLATDRQALARGLGRDVIGGVVPPGVPGYQINACGDACGRDVDRAKALVSELGEVPILEIAVPAGGEGSSSQEAMASTMAAQLAEVGIVALVRPMPLFDFRAYSVSGDQQLFSYGWQGFYPDADAFLSPLFGSEAPDNVTRLADPMLDRWLATTRTEQDREVRLEQLGEAERMVLDHYAVVPLTGFEMVVVSAFEVRDLAPRLDGTFDLRQVWVQKV